MEIEGALWQQKKAGDWLLALPRGNGGLLAVKKDLQLDTKIHGSKEIEMQVNVQIKISTKKRQKYDCSNIDSHSTAFRLKVSYGPQEKIQEEGGNSVPTLNPPYCLITPPSYNPTPSGDPGLITLPPLL